MTKQEWIEKYADKPISLALASEMYDEAFNAGYESVIRGLWDVTKIIENII